MGSKMKPITTKGGKEIPYYDLGDQSLFRDRSVLLLAPSKSGKSVLFNTYAHRAHGKFHRAYMFSATAETDRKFPASLYCAKPFVYTKLDPDKISKIADSAEEIMAIERANNKPETIERCVQEMKRVYDANSFPVQYKRFRVSCRFIDANKKRIADSDTAEEGSPAKLSIDQVEEIRQLNAKYYELIFVDFYQIMYADRSLNVNLALLTPVLYCKSTYRTLVIVNDLGDEFGGLEKRDCNVFDTVMNRGRHINMTMFMLLQGPSQCPKRLRNKWHTIIFANSRAVHDYISSISMGSGQRKSQLVDASDSILAHDESLPEDKRRHWKLIYDTESGRIWYTVASGSEICRQHICQGVSIFQQNNSSL